MRARIPYLARLTGHDTAAAALRPPRRSFAGEGFTPARAPGGDSGGPTTGKAAARVAAGGSRPPAAVAGEEPTARGSTSPPGAGLSRDRAGDDLPDGPGSAAGANLAVGGADHGGSGAGAGDAVAPAVLATPAGSLSPAGPAARAGLAAPTGPLIGPAELPPPLVPAVGVPPMAEVGVVAAPAVSDPAAADLRDPSPAAPLPPLGPPERAPRMPAVGGVAVPAGPDPADQAVALRRPSGSRAGFPTVAGTFAATPTADPAARPAGPAGPGTPEGPTDTAVKRPPVFPASTSQWGTPAELPQTGLRASPSGNETRIASASRILDAADAPRRPGGTAAVHDLLPSPGIMPGPVELSGLRPGGTRPAGGIGRPQVSIGTIEVTVVPPTRPESATGVQPPAPTARSRFSDGVRLAADAGSDRIQSGLRRWYGTAQG